MLKIHETTKSDGSLAPMFLRVTGGELEVVLEDGAYALPAGTLGRVMMRYGAPVEDGAKLTDVGVLDLAGGARVRHVRHLARYDVIAKDWLVYEENGHEPVCALANTVAAALAHLARAVARIPDSGS